MRIPTAVVCVSHFKCSNAFTRNLGNKRCAGSVCAQIILSVEFVPVHLGICRCLLCFNKEVNGLPRGLAHDVFGDVIFVVSRTLEIDASEKRAGGVGFACGGIDIRNVSRVICYLEADLHLIFTCRKGGNCEAEIGSARACYGSYGILYLRALGVGKEAEGVVRAHSLTVVAL